MKYPRKPGSAIGRHFIYHQDAYQTDWESLCDPHKPYRVVCGTAKPHLKYRAKDATVSSSGDIVAYKRPDMPTEYAHPIIDVTVPSGVTHTKSI